MSPKKDYNSFLKNHIIFWGHWGRFGLKSVGNDSRYKAIFSIFLL
jgi:hypothetical protein